MYSTNGGGIIIGSDTQIAAYCYIIDMDHGIDKNELIRKQKNVVEKIFIGEDVWIGAGSKILRGSIIENGAVIGAASLVKTKIESNTVAVGIPIHYLKSRI